MMVVRLILLLISVDFFFQLSGFVLAFSYQEKLRSRVMDLRGFAIARFVRLYPMIAIGAMLSGLLLIRKGFSSPRPDR